MTVCDYINTIKASVTMQDVCDMYGLPVSRGGFISCPFHNEKTASLKIYPGDRGWHCFGCGEGGSVLDFVMQYFGLNLMDAIKKTNADFNLKLPIGKKLSRRQQEEADRRAYELRLKQQIKAQVRNRLNKDYQDALDRYCKYDTAMIKNAPQSDTEPLKREYIEAVLHLPYARYELDMAEFALWEFERSSQ